MFFEANEFVYHSPSFFSGQIWWASENVFNVIGHLVNFSFQSWRFMQKWQLIHSCNYLLQSQLDWARRSFRFSRNIIVSQYNLDNLGNLENWSSFITIYHSFEDAWIWKYCREGFHWCSYYVLTSMCFSYWS
jgi:hypothetical protein